MPITPPEAYALARLVARLPRQRQVRAAFAAAVERLREAGLFDAYMRNRQDMTAEAARETTLRYFGPGSPVRSWSIAPAASMPSARSCPANT